LILLEILLYLRLIVGPGTYQESHIYDLQTSNQTTISAIQTDPVLFAQINQQYAGEASQIIVLDDKEDF
jgi:hypothetical protein